MKQRSCSAIFIFFSLIATYFSAFCAESKHGWGFIDRLDNQSQYPASINFDKGPHDALPLGTVVRIKNLSDGRYYTVEKDAKKKGGYAVVFKEKAKIDNDLAAQFKISRFIDGNLNDSLGLSPVIASKFFMGINPDDQWLEFHTDGFQDSKYDHNQWFLNNEDIKKTSLRNRKSDGLLHIRKITETYVLKEGTERTEPVILTDVWAAGIKSSSEDNKAYKENANKVLWQKVKLFKNSMYKYEANKWVEVSCKDVLDVNWDYGQVEDLLPPAVAKPYEFKWNWDANWGERNDSLRNELNGLKNQAQNWSSYGFAVPNLPAARWAHAIGWGRGDLEPNANATLNDYVNDLNNLRGSVKIAAMVSKPENWSYFAGFTQVAVQLVEHPTKKGEYYTDVWAVASDKSLWRHKDGAWSDVGVDGVSSIAVSAKGNMVWAVRAGKVLEVAQDGGTIELAGIEDAKRVALGVDEGKDKSFWVVTKSGKILRYVDSTWKDIAFPRLVNNISAAGDGSVWCIDKDGSPWKINVNDPAKSEQKPAPALLYQLAVRNDKDVWACDKSYKVWNWNGSWKKIEGLEARFLAVSSGKYEKIIATAAEMGTRIREDASTADDNKVAYNGNDGQVELEIVQRGLDGGILSKSSLDFSPIPANKNPIIEGFAETSLPNFSTESTLKLIPMLGVGAAWLEASLPTPGKASVSFVAQTEDGGALQVVFGDSITNNFIYRISIDTNGARIVKRTWRGIDPSDETVLEISGEQNPLATLRPGVPTAIWVSIDQGLILVGLGNVGENVIMGWLDPNTPKNIIFLGFASDQKIVKYSEIVWSLPVAPTVAAEGIYKEINQSFKISPSPSKISWMKYPLRIKDSGGFEIGIKGDDSAVIGLRKPGSEEHYIVVFGADGNTGLAVKKWLVGKNEYATRTFIKSASYPGIKLDPAISKRFWISYKNGQMMIGLGEYGKNTLTIIYDAAAYVDVQDIGFGSFGKTATEFSNLKIRSAAELAIKKDFEYVQGKSAFGSITGNFRIIMPWRYKFAQTDEFIKFSDMVAGFRDKRMTKTPQQGALYYFQAQIDEKGKCALVWSKAPDPVEQKRVEAEAKEFLAKADLETSKADIERRSGEIDKAAIAAEGLVDKAKFEAAQQTAQQLMSAGAQVMGAAGSAANPIMGAVVTAAGGLLTAGAALRVGLAEGNLADAAQHEVAGVQAQAAADKRALARDEQALRLKNLASQAQGKADFGFRGHDDQTYLDQPIYSALGSAEISPEAVACKAKIAEKIASMPTNINAREDFINSLAMLQEIVLNVMFYNVFDQQNKPKFFQYITNLLSKFENKRADALFPETSKERLEIGNQLIDLLFSAYNNAYIVDPNKDDKDPKKSEKKQKEKWYSYINRIAQDLLVASKSIKIPACWGEYIWLPKKEYSLGANGSGVITFRARATSDIVFCFSPIHGEAIRNTNKNIYEILIGGWNDTKSVIRIKNFRDTAVAVQKEDVLDDINFCDYWISRENGTIRVGIGKPGEGEFMVWEDPYPQNVKFVGISNWDSEVELTGIQMFASMAEAQAAAAASAGTVVNVTGDDDINEEELEEPLETSSEEVVEKPVGVVAEPVEEVNQDPEAEIKGPEPIAGLVD